MTCRLLRYRGRVLRANQAVRLGLRAASRNPELAFGKALLDQGGNLLALLPFALGAVLLSALLDRGALLQALQAGRALGVPLLGAGLAAALLALVAGAAFWSGALPLLAADAELGRRPPSGHFGVLLSRGFPRVLLASLLCTALSALFALACTAALFAAAPALIARPSAPLFAGLAAVTAVTIVGGVLVDLFARLVLVRSAALGDSLGAAFARALSLLGARLGACLAVAVAFLLLELIVGAAAGAITGALSSAAFLDADAELLAMAPRLAVGLATAAVFAWLEVGRQGALAALAADADGLIEAPPDEPPRAEVPTVLERPQATQPDQVIEALPVPEEPVVEALPVPDDEEKPE